MFAATDSVCFEVCFSVVLFTYSVLLFPFAATAFMETLLAANEENDILKFGVCPPWCTQYKSIYIRQSYRDMHELIWANKKKTITVVVGTPGIGKSVFAVYELYRALKESKRVVFQHAVSGTTYVFQPGSVVNVSLVPALDDIDDEATLHFYDAGTRISERMFILKAQLVVFSSPGNSQFADLRKSNARFFHMPAWSLQELKLASQLDDYNTLKEETIEERFTVFGGSARFVLEVDATTNTENVALLETEIKRFELQQLRFVHSEVDFGNVSHRIFHQQVDDDYRRCKLAFASIHVQKRVFEEIEKKKKDKSRMGVE